MPHSFPMSGNLRFLWGRFLTCGGLAARLAARAEFRFNARYFHEEPAQILKFRRIGVQAD